MGIMIPNLAIANNLDGDTVLTLLPYTWANLCMIFVSCPNA